LSKVVSAGRPVSGSWSGGKGERAGLLGRPALIKTLRHSLRFAQQFFAGGQAAAALTHILEIFEFALAIVLLMGSMLHAAIGAFLGRPLGIAQVPGFCRHGPTGLTDKRFLLHGSLLIYISGYTKSNPD
jgi:hypothetical protein